MRVYLDNCSISRQFDELNSNALRLECEAVLSIFDLCEESDWLYFSSDVLLDEILETPDLDKQEKLLMIYNGASEHIEFTEEIYKRAKEFEHHNIKSYDALHLASAEAANADILLTTDRKFINAAKRVDSSVPVKNPVIWLTEVLYDNE